VLQAAVADNDALSGPKTALSAREEFLILDPEAFREEMEKVRIEAQNAIEELARREERVGELLDEWEPATGASAKAAAGGSSAKGAAGAARASSATAGTGEPGEKGAEDAAATEPTEPSGSREAEAGAKSAKGSKGSSAKGAKGSASKAEDASSPSESAQSGEPGASESASASSETSSGSPKTASGKAASGKSASGKARSSASKSAGSKDTARSGEQGKAQPESGETPSPDAQAPDGEPRSPENIAREQGEIAKAAKGAKEKLEGMVDALRQNRLIDPAEERRYRDEVATELERVTEEELPRSASEIRSLPTSPDPERAADEAQRRSEKAADTLKKVADRLAGSGNFREVLFRLERIIELQRKVIDETEKGAGMKKDGEVERKPPTESREF
jgi:hypothetical protein